MFEQGMDLLESNHFEEALQAFDQVLTEEPFHVDALFHRGVTLVNLGRLDDAVSTFRTALLQAPSEGDYHSHLAFALMMAGDHKAALTHFEIALELQPHNVANKVYKACLLAEGKHLGEARRILEEVVQNHGNEGDAIRHYAMVLTALGEVDLALEQWNMLLTQDPNHHEALLRRALLRLQRDEKDAAVRGLREYVALQPGDLSAWLTLLELLSSLQQTEAVIAVAGDAIEAGHESAAIYQLRGREYLASHRLDAAITDLRHSRSLDDRDPESHILLARAYLEKGRVKHALISVNRCLQLMPRDRSALALKASIHHLLGEYDTELELVDSLLKESPGDWRLVRLRTEALMATDRKLEACATVDSFLEQVGNHRRALLLAAQLREECGRIEDARAAYDALMSHRPISSRTYLRYAQHLMGTGELAAAAQTLALAATEDREEPAIATLRATALQRLGDHTAAVEHLQAYLSAHPNAPAEVHWLLGLSLYSLGNHTEALTHFQMARRKGMTNAHGAGRGIGIPGYRCLLAEAQTLHHLRRTAEAIRLLEKNRDQFREQAQLMYLQALGNLYQQSGGLAKAESLFSEGCRLFPVDAAVHWSVAQVRALRGQRAEAVAALKVAVRLEPTYSAEAQVDPSFTKLWWSREFNRLTGWKPLGARVRLGLMLALWVGLGVTFSLILY
jgi:tetratricopeptide (TPR) repeat protein